MHRRTLLALGGVAIASLAGCSGSETANNNRNEAYAEATAEAVDEHSATVLKNWTINDERVHLHFRPTGSEELALKVVAGAYAGNVDNGLDLPLTGYGYDGTGATVMYFEIKPEWGQAFFDDEITEEEYLNSIQNTME